MKKLFFVLYLLNISFFIQAQTLSEKLLYNVDLSDNSKYFYSIRYDDRTGSFFYTYFDYSKHLYTIISDKGNSGDYDFIQESDAVFDSLGNYYVVTTSTSENTKEYLLKNGKELFVYDNIESRITEKNGKVYAVCEGKEKSFIVTYDISTGKLIKGKEYDKIILCSSENKKSELPEFGFTKDNKVYYVAKSNNETFLVIGDEEQKHYFDINGYTVRQDKSGKFAFIASEINFLSILPKLFVVHGHKRYESFDVVYDLQFDSKDNVIYTAGDLTNIHHFPCRIMRGDESISKIYDGGIGDLSLTPDDKIYFSAFTRKKEFEENDKNPEAYNGFAVFDGKEHKLYQEVMNLNVLQENNELLYSYKQNKNSYGLVWGNKEILLEEKNKIISAELMEDNNIAYVSASLEDDGRQLIENRYYLNIASKKSGPFDAKFGPYDKIEKPNYGDSYILSDKFGNYIYLTLKTERGCHYTLHTKNGKSEMFDNISYIYLYNGKAFYTARIDDRKTDKSKYRIYYDHKQITPEYDKINDYKFNEKTGTARFLVFKDNGIYKVVLEL